MVMAEGEVRGGVESVDRALQLLKAFRPSDYPLTLSMLCERTGLHKTTVLRLAASLERYDFLLRMPDKRYRLGPAVARLSQVFSNMIELPELARQPCQALMQATGLSVALYVEQGDARICIYRLDPPEALRDAIDVGDVVPLDEGATSQVFRSYAQRPADAIAPIHAIQPASAEMASIAYPLFAPDDTLAGVLRLSGSATRLAPDLLPALEPMLRDAARTIESRLAAG
jgi:DNA-binding IclR family transcriptional regulator